MTNVFMDIDLIKELRNTAKDDFQNYVQIMRNYL